MAKLYFHYGTMNSGKSIELLKVAHNYEELGLKPLLMTSALDTRDGLGYISSRIGLKREAIALDESIDDLYEYIETLNGKQPIDVVLVDEAQFLHEYEVLDLCDVVDKLNIPVMVYGLKVDFQGKLFAGSKSLIENADKLIEIRTLCAQCSKKAVMNLRLSNGKPVAFGRQVQIGGNESYVSLCRKHWFKAFGEAIDPDGVFVEDIE